MKRRSPRALLPEHTRPESLPQDQEMVFECSGFAVVHEGVRMRDLAGTEDSHWRLVQDTIASAGHLEEGEPAAPLPALASLEVAKASSQIDPPPPCPLMDALPTQSPTSGGRHEAYRRGTRRAPIGWALISIIAGKRDGEGASG